jgi:hypothetical protein
MQMSDMRAEPSAERSPGAGAFGRLAETCEHCVGRPQPPASTAALREADRSKRGEDVSAPPASSTAVFTTVVFTPTVVAREHAPPDASASARHVLLGVFRI